MAVVAYSSARLRSQEELQPFERLVVDLSSSFSTLGDETVDTAVARSVEDIGGALGVDECTLVAFPERGGVAVVHSWAAPPQAPYRDEDLAGMPWLIQRLSRNSVVSLTADDLPERAGLPGATTTRLAVSIVLGTRVAYGVIVGRRQHVGEWRTPFIDRLRLAGEIVAGGLERRRSEEARRELQADAEANDRGHTADIQYLRDEARNRVESEQIIGESTGFRNALDRLGQVAPLDATVLLLGETGTGKELFARALHDRSRRRARTLIRVNCAALPASLIESELFGHERGAFTGAIAARQGRFELADGGTLFLDEIGDLAPELQAKLLRVLQEGEFERVGSSKTRRVDVRMIAATHLNLEAAVAAGRFRADLYYRLSVFPIQLPPLRERREDIPQLVWYFIHRRQRELCRRIATVPAEVMSALQYQDWPGNVRELENVIERALIRSTDGTLQLDEQLRVERPLRLAVAGGDAPAGGTESLDAVQRSHIERVLRECGGRINGPGNAAVRLGIHPNTLRFRIKKLGVARQWPRLISPNGAHLE
jgi:transcriptional regulator with GAF, ATPase, and Fis domain